MADSAIHSGRPVVKIDGFALNDDIANLIDVLMIDDHLQLPDQLTIVWRDPARDVFDRAKVKIGSEIQVGVVATGRGEASGEALFMGEITGLEGEYGVSGQRVTLRAYDLSHRLHRGKRTEAYPNAKDSDIAKRLAKEAGLKVVEAEITDSVTVHPYVSQINLTDWEFLRARSREIGFEVGVTDGKFIFRKAQVNQNAPSEGDLLSTGALQMVFGSDLLEFHPRVSAAAQVTDVYARGWSYLDKREVVGHATTADCNSAPAISSKPSDIAKKFPTKPYVVTDRALTTQAEADAAAKGAAHQSSAALGEADGVARGNVKIRAGATMSISAVSPCFVGAWTVTNSRHVFNQSGYKTSFAVTGRQERSLLGLASGGITSGTASASGPPIYGVVVGIVSNIKDPEGLSRIRLTFPWLSDKYETDWTRLAMPGAGESRGFFWLPEVGDEILVAFEQGDVRRPYGIGSLFNGKDKWSKGKEQYDSSGRVTRRGFRGSGKHAIGFFELPGNEGIFLQSGNKKLKIVMNQTENSITIESSGSIQVTGSDITVDASKSLELSAKTDLKIKAMNISIKADTTVDIDGAMITLN
jgi:phage protein D/phage baseplate assembly protein gpV